MSHNSFRKIHRYSAVVLTVFIFLHLTNHLFALSGPEMHIAIMEKLRLVYRNIVVETLLITCVALQIISGIYFLRQKGFKREQIFDKLQVYSGLYLAFFLFAHVGAVLAGRTFFQLDTNFYFGAYPLANFPFMLIFIPYYALSILAIFTHIACFSRWMLIAKLGQKAVNRLAWSIIGGGFVVTFLILLTFNGAFYKIEFPEVYDYLGQ